jgi:hypothetical protein
MKKVLAVLFLMLALASTAMAGTIIPLTWGRGTGLMTATNSAAPEIRWWTTIDSTGASNVNPDTTNVVYLPPMSKVVEDSLAAVFVASGDPVVTWGWLEMEADSVVFPATLTARAYILAANSDPLATTMLKPWPDPGLSLAGASNGAGVFLSGAVPTNGLWNLRIPLTYKRSITTGFPSAIRIKVNVGTAVGKFSKMRARLVIR